MLMRSGVAEIGQHAVAHVLGNEAPFMLDQFRATTLISADDPRLLNKSATSGFSTTTPMARIVE
jgi:hypothetical protein